MSYERALKFSTVFGTTFPNNPITMSPLFYPSTLMVNFTLNKNIRLNFLIKILDRIY